MPTLTKDTLTPARRGRPGTRVLVGEHVWTENQHTGERVINLPAGVYEVVDLFARKSFNDPERIGIAPLGRGYAFGVRLSDLTLEDGSVPCHSATVESCSSCGWQA